MLHKVTVDMNHLISVDGFSYTSDGRGNNTLRVAGWEFNTPYRLSVDEEGINLYVTDKELKELMVFLVDDEVDFKVMVNIT